MVKKKGKSKRIALKDKYKIQRRVVESHRKDRKQAKRDSKAGIVRHNKKKDPGIPNSWPFKQELLQNIRQSNERMEQRKLEEKERRAAKGGGGGARNLSELVAEANAKQSQFVAKSGMVVTNVDDSVKTLTTSHGQQSRRAYLRSLKQVIESSDVILQVIDSRDPLGTRIHPAIEAGILSHYDKRMVLVMNKIDLIPKKNVSEWLTFLRRSHPTVALKAGTTQSRSNEGGKSSGVGQAKGESALSSSSAVGVEGLLQLLKNYARSNGEAKKSKTCISVGIIGYPNVGKSSILNSLKRARAVGVSPRPGFTTSLQEVVLDKNIRLIDSPGVVFDDDDTKAGAGAVLRNGIDPDSIDDPIPAIQELIGRCSMESLMMTYNVPAFPTGPEGCMTFLAMVARSKGRVLKGGIPDKLMAGRLVIKDWNQGKIPYYSVPPNEKVDTTASNVGEAKILNQFSEKFDINKILEDHDNELMQELDDVDEMDFVQMNSVPRDAVNADKMINYLTKEGSDDEDSDDAMDEDGAHVNAQMQDAEDFDFDN
uniref:CP-type G domain-containing protein n=1 Tax=Skeletonema marinoi TaxID=267567 RepID=A0A7S2PN85_9STRA|mmetsp:Transcript_26532/g.45121  ORF Transcript_26532/g.45121 Transcript_26532/m.45121 type:complete len:538 (+) Transcript_26532:145-1758(+)